MVVVRDGQRLTSTGKRCGVVARLRGRRLGNLSFTWESVFHENLSDADAVTCYLMLGVMARLDIRLDQLLRLGTRVVSNSFWFRGE